MKIDVTEEVENLLSNSQMGFLGMLGVALEEKGFTAMAVSKAKEKVFREFKAAIEMKVEHDLNGVKWEITDILDLGGMSDQDQIEIAQWVANSFADSLGRAMKRVNVDEEAGG